MESRALSGALLCFIFLGLPHLVTSAPAECIIWQQVFPNCDCRSALGENGEELPTVALVDCSSRDLRSVPQPQRSYDRTLYELRLSNNRITTLLDNAFQGVKIRHLDLTGNSLGRIADNAFSGTENEMVVLNIEGDSSTPPQRNALSKLNDLEELTMKNYNVADLSPNTNELYFHSFPKLRKLTLDNWGIVSIGPHAFLAAGNNYRLRSLALLNQELENLPVDVLGARELENLKSLRISHTKIKAVTPYAFSSLNSVEEIILSNNEINDIEEDSFENVGDTLEILDFSNNFLGAGQRNDLPHLKGLTNLRQLSFKNNEFSNMPKMEYLGNGQAFHLDFSNNQLVGLSNNDLVSYITRLEGLDLTQNKITQIDDNTFSGASALSSFTLAYQSGDSDAAVNVPTSLTSLTYLDLHGQKLEETSLWQKVGQLRNLQTLILHSAELTGIPDFAFENLLELNKLDLSYNHGISQLTDKTFVGPRRLRTLILTSIGITNIPACLFHNQIGDLSLDLGSTLITCNCTVKTLLERFRNGSVTFPKAASIPRCSDGSLLTQLDPAGLTCDPEECANYYTTPTPTQPHSSASTNSPSPTPSIQIRILNVNINSMTIAWDLSDSSGLLHYRITVISSIHTIKDVTIPSVSTQQNIQDLTADTYYLMCVYAYFSSIPQVSSCENKRTPVDGNPSDSSSADTGIIVGIVVGVLAILVILAAVVYLLVIRRRPQKAPGTPPMAGPVQPRTFTKSELPTMNGDSRSFVKAKKNGLPDSKPTGGMQVVAISDGQTRPSGGRVGRAHLLLSDGTYEPMNKSKSKDLDYEPMEKPVGPPQGTVNAAYENDHGPLPPTPRKKEFDPEQGTVNAAYENDHGSLPPTPRKKQFDPKQGTVNAAYENDHGSLPSSPVRQNFDQRSPRSPHGYYNEAFSGYRYDEIDL